MIYDSRKMDRDTVNEKLRRILEQWRSNCSLVIAGDGFIATLTAYGQKMLVADLAKGTVSMQYIRRGVFRMELGEDGALEFSDPEEEDGGYLDCREGFYFYVLPA